MDKPLIAFAEAGEPGLLILCVPAEFSASSSETECFAIPVMSRNNGFLLCILRGVVSEDVLIDCMSGDDPNNVLGPSKGIPVQLQEEGEEQTVVPIAGTFNVLLVDFSDDALGWLREYDPGVEIPDGISSFAADHPFAIPTASQLVPIAQEWVNSQGSERANFYSAQEDPEPPTLMKSGAKGVGKPKGSVPKRVTNAEMLEQMEAMVSQMKALSLRTEMLEQAKVKSVGSVGDPGGGNISGVPAVSAGLGIVSGPPATAFTKYTSLVGPPPKVRQTPLQPKVPTAVVQDPPPGEDPSIAQALSQQSSAVLALVSHLANQSDPLTDIPGVGSLSTSTKGVQKREKMQQDLAMGSSTYFLQVMQQLHKKLHPSLPLPKTTEELQHLSVLTYLERSGGFKHARDSGLLMWLIGYAVDAAAVGDSSSSRTFGLADGGVGSECCGWRLDHRLLAFLSRRSSHLPLPGEVEHNVAVWKAILQPCSSSMVIGGFGFHKRDGAFAEQETRFSKEGSKGCGPRESITKEKAEIPKTAEARCRPSKGSVNGEDEEILTLLVVAMFPEVVLMKVCV